MNKDIRLYLGGQLVEWNKTPDIEFTYQTTDYTNPTVIKNSYTKTVTIDGTPSNNNLFNHIWNLERIMDDGFNLFNPSQRVSFELYNNSEIVEKGYAKLDSVKKVGYKIEYNITLYGGLGSFFYALSYDLGTDKERTMADLNYLGTSNPDTEFDFEINKNRIWNAWDALNHYGNNTGSYRKYDFINFAPCYNGLPENFDSDKVLINAAGLENNTVRYTTDNGLVNGTLPTHLTSSGDTFNTMNGYITGKMMRQCDEWEMRDLRSYLQRPVLSVRGMFDAISNPVNNGGYSVRLDGDFFSPSNPYYWNSWITLPMLAPETDGVDEMIDWEWYKAEEKTDLYSGKIDYKWLLGNIEPITGTPDEFQMDVEIHATITGTSANRLYTSTLVNNSYDPDYPDLSLQRQEYIGCVLLQLYGFGANGNGSWSDKVGKCGSNLLCLTSKLNGNFINSTQINTWYHKPYQQSEIQYIFGYWQKVSGSDYVWHNETDNTNTIHLQMDSNLMSEIPNIALGVGQIHLVNGALYNRAVCAYKEQWYEYYDDIEKYNFWGHVDLNNLDSSIIYKVNGKMRSFQPVTKKDLLGGLEGTPCDWLLSYCKLFGLFIEKDKFDNIIYIKMRNNWYINEIENLDKLIDRSKDMNITPLTFESKWYNFNYVEADGKYMEQYKDQYSTDFGKQLIDTKYNFDADEVDLLEDNKFRNGLVALEKSNYFNTKYDGKGMKVPQCLFNWCTVSYYNNDGETLDTNMCLPQNHTTVTLNPNMPKEFYDAVPKLHLKGADKNPVDGDGVLVFFDGIKSTGNDCDYWISDDVDEMFIDSENPCWLCTHRDFNSAWTQGIAIKVNQLPEFNRYIEHHNTITATLDFGYTKELYVPYYRYDINKDPTMYENFWKKYIQDLYSVDTRKVDCYVNLNSNDVYGFMKKFYWWDNSLWVCTKVENFDIAVDRSTLCSFTKVNDMDSYLSMPTFDDYYFRFFRIDGGGNIPCTGTTGQLTVRFQVDSSTDWVVIDAGLPYVHFTTAGNSVVGQAGTGNIVEAVFLPNNSSSSRTATFVGGNQEGETIYITVTQDGKPKEKFLKVDPNKIEAARTAGSYTATVKSSSNWYGYGGENWITASTLSSGSGTTNVTLSLQANSGKETRRCEYLFINTDGVQDSLIVEQKATANAVIIKDSREKGTLPYTGGTIHYTVKSDAPWVLEPLYNTDAFVNCSLWNVANQATTGTTVEFEVNENLDNWSNNIYFRLVVDGTEYKYPYDIDSIDGAPCDYTVSSSPTAITVNINNNLQHDIEVSEDWITTGLSYSDLVLNIASNSGSVRNGAVYITYVDDAGNKTMQTISITQKSATSSLTVSPTSANVGYEASSLMVSIDSSSMVTITSIPSWISLAFRSASSSMVFNIERNGLNIARTGTITMSNTDGNTATITVTQDSGYNGEYVLDYSLTDSEFEASGGSATLIIRSNDDWTITEENE